MITPVKCSIIILLLLVSFVSFSQKPVAAPKAELLKPERDSAKPLADSLRPLPDTARPVTDTVREFEIIRGPSMRSIYVDSVTTLQTIAGGAIVKQGTTLFNADSIVINPATHIVEAFGNVHINQSDSVQTYSQYLKYIGTEKTAYLSKDVKLNDKRGTLYTQDLDYNLGTGIGNYHAGGKVINGKTIITSQDGTYYADTKDIYFKNNVVVNEPKNHINTDSLLYNLRTQGSNFNGPTYIKNKEADIYTTQGTYDFNTGNALFTSRSTVKDSSGRVYIANNMAIDNKSASAQLEGNAIVKDSAGGYLVLANQIFLNKKNNSFLATRKPVLIIKQKDDSIYVAADTIFSGYSTHVKNEAFIARNDSISNDSLHKKFISDTLNRKDAAKAPSMPAFKNARDSSYYLAHVIDSLRAGNGEPPENNQKKNAMAGDSSRIIPKQADSIQAKIATPLLTIPEKDTMLPRVLEKVVDTTLSRLDEKDSIASLKSGNIVDTTHGGKGMEKDSLRSGAPGMNMDSVKSLLKKKEAAGFLSKGRDKKLQESLKSPGKDTTAVQDSSRYFLAFHHVRIFNDSLQSICDSLFFSAKDSVFRLYYDPVIWSGHSQIKGDTIFLFTKNKKPDRLYAFDKGIIINKTTQGFFNQIAGKTINGYFTNGVIDYMRVKGSQSESIYYAQDNDSAYLGMNRATGDVIDLYFKKDNLEKVLFVNDIQGKFYPMRQIPGDQRFLKDFIWLDEKRPKNKLELFE